MRRLLIILVAMGWASTAFCVSSGTFSVGNGGIFATFKDACDHLETPLTGSVTFYSISDITENTPITLTTTSTESAFVTLYSTHSCVVNISASPNNNALTVKALYTVVDGLEITGWGGSSAYQLRCGVYVDATSGRYSKIRHCKIHDSGSGDNRSQEGVNINPTCDVIANCFWNIAGPAVYVTGTAGSGKIHNNTIFNTGYGAYAVANPATYGSAIHSSMAIDAKNNIVIECSTTCIRGTATNIDYNCTSDEAAGAHSLSNRTAAEVFVSSITATLDLSLKSTSPAINAGADLRSTCPLDITRTAYNTPMEMGAYAYGGNDPAPSVSRRRVIQVIE